MARPPTRNKNVFFLGAGFSRAAGLPNTAELLAEVHELLETHAAWGISKNLGGRLSTAYKYFYPERGSGFRPDVVDFFSVLTTYNAIDHGGLPEGFADKYLLDDLKTAIAQILCTRTRSLNDALIEEEHEFLDRMILPGNVIITSNWDCLVERLCETRSVRVRLCGQPDPSHLLLLKLHGSVDWVIRENAKKEKKNANYSSLRELLFSTRAHQYPLGREELLRVRINRPGAVWQVIKGASVVPLMITMSPGKAASLEPLISIWEDAYRGISGARDLVIAGYSMPADDVEIRTLLRAGLVRGSDAHVIVRNPAPDVHIRTRQLLDQVLESDYRAINRIG